MDFNPTYTFNDLIKIFLNYIKSVSLFLLKGCTTYFTVQVDFDHQFRAQ